MAPNSWKYSNQFKAFLNFNPLLISAWKLDEFIFIAMQDDIDNL
jgi:hypothetical protein